MKKTLLKLAAICSPLLAMAATPARAGFDPAVVPADAQWIFYLDVQALRSSALGTELMTVVPQLNLDAKELPVKVNIQKLIESVGSATAYGTSFSHDPKKMDGALVVRGTPDLRKIIEGLLLASVDGSTGKMQVKEIADLGADAYEVGGELLVALPPGDAIVVSKSRESLAGAQALLRSDKGSMARGKASALARLIPNSATTYLLAASFVPRENTLMPKEGPQARILQMASAASIVLGEDGTMTTARIQIDATSSDMADKLIKILQGLVAMLSFTETNDEALAAFLRSVTVEKTSSGALLNLAYPTDRLVQMVKTLRADETAKSAGQSHDQPHMGRSRPPGRVVDEWTGDKDLASDGPAAGNIVTRRVESVELATGSTIWLNGHRDAGEHARFDYLEITPANNPGGALRFEAEYLRLDDYETEEAAFASGGELIKLRGNTGSARLVFPAAPGTYAITVAYVDENDGRSSFSVSITEPKPQPGPEAPTP